MDNVEVMAGFSLRWIWITKLPTLALPLVVCTYMNMDMFILLTAVAVNGFIR